MSLTAFNTASPIENESLHPSAKLKATAFGLVMPAATFFIMVNYFGRQGAIGFVFYLALVLVEFWLLPRVRDSANFFALALGVPLLSLLVVKQPQVAGMVSVWGTPTYNTALTGPDLWIGISYMAFRLCSLAVEVRNQQVECPNWKEMLGFSFFVPTLFVGPISRYSVYRRSLSEYKATALSRYHSFQRLVIGGVKFFFFANLFRQLGYESLLTGEHPLTAVYAWIAVFAYFLFLYTNFSGACDLAIGTASLMGVEVEENFAYPLSARNSREFWNRWHMTLTRFLRELVFTPVSMDMAHRLPSSLTKHIVVPATFAVFLAMGIWHGVHLNFIVFGAIHAAGVLVSYYYQLGLRRWLTPLQLQTYMASNLITGAAITITFVFNALSLAFFANSFKAGARILEHLF